VSRQHIDAAVPALALRRAQAAAALGMSVDTFDQHVRPYVPAARIGGVVVYRTADLDSWLAEQATSPIDDVARTIA